MVEPAPSEEEIDEIPADANSFVADGETYYYVNFNLYVEFEEKGKTGYVNGEPFYEVVDSPDGSDVVELDGG